MSKLARDNSAEVTKQMMQKIIDDNLMTRYGTSIEINMGREYHKYLESKLKILKKEFEKINKNSDDGIDIDELTQFLNLYQNEKGKTFERNYASKLFEVMDKDRSNKISIDEFVSTYIILEEKIKLNQIRLEKALGDLQVKKAKYERKCLSSKNELLNENGISQTALLNIKILEAKDLKPMDSIGRADPFVIISLDDQVEKSNYVSDTLDPVWNEEFDLRVNSLDSSVTISIYDRNVGEVGFQGSVTIPLRYLENQQLVDRWYNLTSSGIMEEGQIRLKLQLVWSRYIYYQNLVVNCDLKMTKIKKDLKELEKYIELITKPFGILLYVEIDNNLIRKIHGEETDIYAHTMSLSISFPKYGVLNTSLKSSIIGSTFGNVLKNTFLKKAPIEWSYMTKVFMYLILILSAINLIERSDFINLGVGVAIWVIFIKDSKYDVLSYLVKFYWVLIGTLIYDVVWLYFHTSAFVYSEINLLLKSISLLSSYLNITIKFLLFLTLSMQIEKARFERERERMRHLHQNYSSSDSARHINK